MSKIGRKPIHLGAVHIKLDGQAVHYKGAKSSGIHELPSFIKPVLQDKDLILEIAAPLRTSENNRYWGLHRALLANAIRGADTGFTKQIQINGLGFKAVLSGNKVTFTIGYTHKIDVALPKEVTLEVDKTGQLLTFKSSDRRLLGEICDKVRSLRPPEPYKGTGIKYMNEVIVRKAGKTKAS